MALFTPADRKSIMDYIVSFTEQNEHIVALVAVGSGSFGYTDELSDLDFVVAIDSGENLDIVKDSQMNLARKRRLSTLSKTPIYRCKFICAIIFLRLTSATVSIPMPQLPEHIGKCCLTKPAPFRRRCKLLGRKQKMIQK